MTALRAPRTRVALAILLPLLVVTAVFAPVLSGGLHSDDYMLGLFAKPGLDSADWESAFADFGRPWLGFDAPFYRPLLSLSFALDIDRAGGVDPEAMHTTNLVLHLLTAAAAAWLCALHAPRRRALAALLGGLFVGLHPVAVEPIAWLAARNSELEVFVRTASMLAFAIALRRRGFARRIAMTAAWSLAALTLSAKESALVLPISLLALDLLHRLGSRSRASALRTVVDRALVRRQLGFAPLWVLYFGLRTVLFGHPIGDPGGGAVGTQSSLIERATGKLDALFTPSAEVVGAAPELAGSAFTLNWAEPAAAIALLALAFAALLRRPASTVLAIVWIALHTAPTFQLEMTGGLSGSRMLYGALPPLAILLMALPLDGQRRPLGRPLIPLAALLTVGVLLIAALQPTTRSILERYDTTWSEMRTAEQQLGKFLSQLPPGVPIAVTSLPQPVGLPPCNANTWFPFAERPIQERDYPLVPLGHLTVPIPGAEEMTGDGGAVRALREAGAPILAWNPGAGRLTARGLTPLQRALPALRPSATPQASAPSTEYRFDAPVDAESVALLRFTVRYEDATSTRRSGAIVLRTVPLPAETPALPDNLIRIPFGNGVAREAATTNYEVDLTRGLGPPVFATVGLPITGFAIELDDRGTPQDVQAIAEMPALAAPFDRDAAPLDSLQDLGERLSVPTGERPATEPPASLRLVLLGPIQPHVLALPNWRAPDPIPTELLARLQLTDRLSRSAVLWCYLEARPENGRPGNARSALVPLRLHPE